MTKAVVVGSGPNGLAAALTLADAGLEVEVMEASDEVGGGTRSAELTLPGLLHDECSGFHPLAVDTPFSRHFDLARHGLNWRWAEVEFSHPLDGRPGQGRGAAVRRDVEATAVSLGADARAWRRTFGHLAPRFGDIAEDFLQPLLHVPRHPVKLAAFGAMAAAPASLLARVYRTEEAQALFAGVAAHAMRPFSSPVSSAIGVALGTAAHTYGWPVAEGGSAAITRAVVAALEERGARVHTGVRVNDLREVADADVVMFDTTPAAAARIAGRRIPERVRRALTKYRHGPGVFKVEFAVEGGVPWLHEDSRLAGTVHVGGTLAEVAFAEAEVNRGRMPERPYVLLGQQYLADPTRGRDGIVPVYAYAHVPAGWTGDATGAIEAQIERFAPGFGDRVLARHVRSVQAMEEHNANYVGGDVVTGSNDALQLVFRPRIARDPYTLGRKGLFICSAATPPGAGAHGMCGWNAAQSALAQLGRG